MELGQLTTGQILRLHPEDRRRHVYLVGKTGTGKSTLLENMALQSIAAGEGVAVVDPHGQTAERIADAIPPERLNDTIYIDPADLDRPVGFNVLGAVSPDVRPLVAAQVVSAFKAIWGDSWGYRLEYILYNSLRLLLDNRADLLALPRLLVDDPYRAGCLRKCADPVVRLFWTEEFALYDLRFRREAIAPIQNKIGALLASPALRNMVAQRSTIDISQIMDRGKILILNLAKGKLGDGPSHLLGALFVSAFAQAAESRAKIAEPSRRDFTLYVDEFQNFATDNFGTILSEARKWRLSLVLANQFMEQVPRALQAAVLGNAGTLIAFRVGAADAVLLAPELGLANPQVLTDTANFQAWSKFIQAGVPTNALQLATFPPAHPAGRLRQVIAHTRACHSRPRQQVELRINQFLTPALTRAPRVPPNSSWGEGRARPFRSPAKAALVARQ